MSDDDETPVLASHELEVLLNRAADGTIGEDEEELYVLGRLVGWPPVSRVLIHGEWYEVEEGTFVILDQLAVSRGTRLDHFDGPFYCFRPKDVTDHPEDYVLAGPLAAIEAIHQEA